MTTLLEQLWSLILRSGRGPKAQSLHRCYGRLVARKYQFENPG